MIKSKSKSKSKSLKSFYGDGGYPRNAPPKTDNAKTRILKPIYGGCVAVLVTNDVINIDNVL